MSFFQCDNGGAWNFTQASEEVEEKVKNEGEIFLHKYPYLSPEADTEERNHSMSKREPQEEISGAKIKQNKNIAAYKWIVVGFLKYRHLPCSSEILCGFFF